MVYTLKSWTQGQLEDVESAIELFKPDTYDALSKLPAGTFNGVVVRMGIYAGIVTVDDDDFKNIEGVDYSTFDRKNVNHVNLIVRNKSPHVLQAISKDINADYARATTVPRSKK